MEDPRASVSLWLADLSQRSSALSGREQGSGTSYLDGLMIRNVSNMRYKRRRAARECKRVFAS